MDSRAWNVGAACFAGASIGWLVMVIGDFGPVAIVLSTVVSGLVGFFATDVGRTRAATRVAWQAAVRVARSVEPGAAKRFVRETTASIAAVARFAAYPILTLRPGIVGALPAAALTSLFVTRAHENRGLFAAIEMGAVTYLVLYAVLPFVSFLFLHFAVFSELRLDARVGKWFPSADQVDTWVAVYGTTVEREGMSGRERWQESLSVLRFRVWFGWKLPWRAQWAMAWGMYFRPLLIAVPLHLIDVAWSFIQLLLAMAITLVEWIISIVIGIPLRMLRASGTFLVKLFVGVHSRYSRMALVDAPLGMLLTYVALRATYGSAFLELSPWQQASFALLAGATSFLLGVLSCELVAKRAFGIRPA